MSSASRADSKAPTFTRAEIFLTPWNVTTFARVSADAVRKGYGSMTVLRDEGEIAGLVALLDPASLHPPASPNDRVGDFRLVVDLVRADGTRESFAAEYGRLVRLLDGASRPIDDAFRRRFTFSKGAH